MYSTVKSSTRVAAATILCFGDSWTDGNAYGLQEQLKKHGHSNVQVVNKDYWGSTAEYFANNPKLLPNAVSSYQAKFVLLSMGGNDFKNIYWRHRQYVTPWTAVSGIEKNVKVVLDALFEAHPDIQVVTYGYDFPGDVEQFFSGFDPKDIELSNSMKALLWMYNMFGVRLINYSAMQLGHSYQKLSEEYAKKGHSFTYVPLWGSLQSAAQAKVKESTSTSLPLKLKPQLGKPSPQEFMNDPIHANRKGYEVLLGNLYNTYFSKFLSQSA